MNKKKTIILAVIICLFILLILILLFQQKDKDNGNLSNINGLNNQSAINSQLAGLPLPSQERLVVEEKYPLGLKSLAFSITERYGTYSSQSNFKSLRDLESLSTASMQKKISNIISGSSVNPAVYDAYETKALSAVILAGGADSDSSEILIKTQRTHYTSDKTETFYQDIILKFVKFGEDWLLNDANWQ